MTYYLFFVLYLGAGAAIAAAGFAWALRSGQFSGQARAAFLPLEGEEPIRSPGAEAARWTPAVYATALFLLLAAGVIGAAVVMLMSNS